MLLVLVFLAVGHLFIMHILNNVETINYAFVASRWTDPETGWIWRLWDLTMINLAVIHGFNGLRQVLYEYVTRPAAGSSPARSSGSVAVVLIGIGGYAILMFQRDDAYIKEHPLKVEPTDRAARTSPEADRPRSRLRSTARSADPPDRPGTPIDSRVA